MRNSVSLWLFCVVSFCLLVVSIVQFGVINTQRKDIFALKIQQKQVQYQTSMTIETLQNDVFKLTENVSVLDASIEPDNKRWARIKQVRKIVIGVLESFNKKHLTIKEITDISTAVIDFSEENDVPVSLVLAVMTVESAFEIKAVSKADARGLLQLMPDTAAEISIEISQRNFSSSIGHKL